MRTCTLCGQNYNDDKKFCTKCGSPLVCGLPLDADNAINEEQIVVSAPSIKSESKLVKPIVIFLIIGVCFLIGYIAIKMAANKSENTLTQSPIGMASAPDVTEFEIALGKTVYGFTYTDEGVLLYDGKSFSPEVRANKSDVPKFKISILNSKKLAAGIGLDIDGKTYLFLMDIRRGTSREIEEGRTAGRIYWSPSEKYLVVLCTQEGNRFIQVDLNSGNVLDKGFLKPPGNDRSWYVKDDPHWIGKTDVLEFTVNETCHYYEGKCDGNNMNNILAVHKLKMDAATLNIYQ